MREFTILHYHFIQQSNWILLQDAARRAAVELTSIEPHRLQVHCTDTELRVLDAGVEVRPRVVLHRTVSSFAGIVVPALSIWQSQGAAVLNDGTAAYASRDKLLTYLALRRAGLPLVDSVAFVEPTGLDPALASGSGVIVKPAHGVRGEGIWTAASTTEVAERWEVPVTGAHPQPREHHLVQPLIGGGGRDLRAYVVGTACLGLMERTAAPGEVRANLALGASARALPLEHPAAALAVQALQATGLDVGGVDLIEDEDGVIRVLEVDAWAGFAGITETTGADVAGAVLELAGQRSATDVLR